MSRKQRPNAVNNATQSSPLTKSVGFTSECVFLTPDCLRTVRATIRHVRNIQNEIEPFCFNLSKNLSPSREIHRFYRISGDGNYIYMPQSRSKIRLDDLFDCKCSFQYSALGPPPNFMASLDSPKLGDTKFTNTIELYEILSFNDAASSYDASSFSMFGCNTISRDRYKKTPSKLIPPATNDSSPTAKKPKAGKSASKSTAVKMETKPPPSSLVTLADVQIALDRIWTQFFFVGETSIPVYRVY